MLVRGAHKSLQLVLSDIEAGARILPFLRLPSSCVPASSSLLWHAFSVLFSLQSI